MSDIRISMLHRKENHIAVEPQEPPDLWTSCQEEKVSMQER